MNYNIMSLENIMFNTCVQPLLRILAPKQPDRTWLCTGVTPAPKVVESSKDPASLLVCTRKKMLGWGWGLFVSDVISEGLLDHLVPLQLALGLNC